MITRHFLTTTELIGGGTVTVPPNVFRKKQVFVYDNGYSFSTDSGPVELNPQFQISNPFSSRTINKTVVSYIERPTWLLMSNQERKDYIAALKFDRSYGFHGYTEVKSSLAYQPLVPIDRTWSEVTSGNPVETDIYSLSVFPLHIQLSAFCSESYPASMRVFGDDTVAPTRDQLVRGFHQMFSDARLVGLESVSIANFLIELKDIVKLKSLLHLKLNSRSVSDAHLSIGFGILPTISDVQDMFNIATKLNSAIVKWNDFAKSRRILNTHTTLVKDVMNHKIEYADVANGAYLEYEFHIQRTRLCKMSAFFIPTVLDAIDLDRLSLELLGLDKIASVVWEAIPYSFLVDWFFKVSDLIDEFENHKPILQTSLISCGYSYKNEYLGVLYSKYTIEGKTVSCPRLEIKYKTYDRQPWDPGSDWPELSHSFGLSFTKTQSLSHVAYMASLLEQRRH